jgi:hypothetical protein
LSSICLLPSEPDVHTYHAAIVAEVLRLRRVFDTFSLADRPERLIMLGGEDEFYGSATIIKDHVEVLDAVIYRQ